MQHVFYELWPILFYATALIAMIYSIISPYSDLSILFFQVFKLLSFIFSVLLHLYRHHYSQGLPISFRYLALLLSSKFSGVCYFLHQRVAKTIQLHFTIASSILIQVNSLHFQNLAVLYCSTLIKALLFLTNELTQVLTFLDYASLLEPLFFDFHSLPLTLSISFSQLMPHQVCPLFHIFFDVLQVPIENHQ